MLIKLKRLTGSSGQSIIEIIIAMAIFVTIVSGTMAAVLGSFSTTRLAEEETKAVLYAREGIDAAQSIRNQDWSNLSNGTHGVNNSGSTWTFSGSSDDPEGSGKYTRTVTISDVQRDSNNDIVGSGGSVDPNTKQVTSNVTWNFSPLRNNTVEQTTYLTNWQLSTGTTTGGGTPPTPTPTPSPAPTTCSAYCALQGYSAGVCRANVNQCNANSETNVAAGNAFCTGGGGSDTCCCAP